MTDTAKSLSELRASAAQAHTDGDTETALRAYAAYLAQVPGDARMWSNLGALHRRAHRTQIALIAHRRALTLAPNDVSVMNNAANALSDVGQYDESLALRHRLLDHTPDDLNHLAMVGRCLRGKGDYAAAIRWLDAARARFPDDAELQMQLAFAQLGAGDYAQAFRNYRARWRAGELKPRNLPFPEWTGQPLDGKTIVILPEQGFGDAILFARFAAVLRGRGARVVMQVKKPLRRLFAGIDGVDAIVPDLTADMQADYWINIMDLALLHFEQDGSVPPPCCLTMPDDSSARARALLKPHAGKMRIGVVWTGSVTYKGNAFRSFSHRDYLGLAAVPGVQLFSLYKGPELAPYHADGTDGVIIDTGSSERDFADTAAMMRQLDLVITSDTATAHLAGSLGVPVWVVLHWDAFWVYRHAGTSTAWYPSMRLFRQHEPLDWDGVMADVTSAVRAQMEI
ncbi:tetratricopeptide repeat-containing glycosyltransferase family protein [Loktanella sp. TSTF-M6]|uniref:Tetratricopeptide repeat-containing glycosyltransferase family protein n=1 Tax=Loktanella gaetbuli TaxID=2881335 RepID=A0ABS8BUE9_9RHOB|nr:tetratricopeptide repeat-containing glycosyltransferase family protein [Loktanella gaetbuli]MCB5199353.1 tetratricopeptide repeat-containing glycosyltransferase family protein [Loktanella gaetbuli]